MNSILKHKSVLRKKKLYCSIHLYLFKEYVMICRVKMKELFDRLKSKQETKRNKQTNKKNM